MTMPPIALSDIGQRSFMAHGHIIISQQEVLVKMAVMFQYEVNPFIYNEYMIRDQRSYIYQRI
jgi:hypothetical protein